MGPFIMNPEGVGRIFVPLAGIGRRTVSRNSTSPSKAPSQIRCIRKQSNNPVVKKYTTDMDKYGTPSRDSRSSAPPIA